MPRPAPAEMVDEENSHDFTKVVSSDDAPDEEIRTKEQNRPLSSIGPSNMYDRHQFSDSRHRQGGQPDTQAAYGYQTPDEACSFVSSLPASRDAVSTIWALPHINEDSFQKKMAKGQPDEKAVRSHEHTTGRTVSGEDDNQALPEEAIQQNAASGLSVRPRNSSIKTPGIDDRSTESKRDEHLKVDDCSDPAAQISKRSAPPLSAVGAPASGTTTHFHAKLDMDTPIAHNIKDLGFDSLTTDKFWNRKRPHGDHRAETAHNTVDKSGDMRGMVVGARLPLIGDYPESLDEETRVSGPKKAPALHDFTGLCDTEAGKAKEDSLQSQLCGPDVASDAKYNCDGRISDAYGMPLTLGLPKYIKSEAVMLEEAGIEDTREYQFIIPVSGGDKKLEDSGSSGPILSLVSRSPSVGAPAPNAYATPVVTHDVNRASSAAEADWSCHKPETSAPPDSKVLPAVVFSDESQTDVLFEDENTSEVLSKGFHQSNNQRPHSRTGGDQESRSSHQMHHSVADNGGKDVNFVLKPREMDPARGQQESSATETGPAANDTNGNQRNSATAAFPDESSQSTRIEGGGQVECYTTGEATEPAIFTGSKTNHK